MKPVPRLNWTQVMTFAKLKQLDVLPAVARTQQRDEFLLFTKPYMSFPVVIFTRNDHPQISGLKDFFGKRIAVVKGYAVQDFFQERRPDIQLVLVESVRKGLELLAIGGAEAFVNDVASGTYWIQKSYLTNLKVSGVVNIQAKGLSFGVRKDWPELVPILEKAIASISEKKHTAIRQKWVDIEVASLKEPMFWKTVLQFVGIVVLIIFILLIVFRFMFSVQKNGITLQFGTKRFLIICITFLGFVVTLVLAVTWIVLDYSKRKILDDVRSSLQTVLLTTNESLDIWVLNQKDFLDQYSRNAELPPLVQNMLAVSPNKKEILASQALTDIRRFFKKNQTQFGKGFFIINHHFISIASMRDANVGSRNLIAVAMPDAMKRVFASEVVFIPHITSDVPLNGKSSSLPPTMFIAAPVRDEHGTIIAAMTQRLSPEKDFSRIIQLGRMGKSGETYAFDLKGRLLSESRFDDHLRQVGLIQQEEKGILNIEIRDPGNDLVQGL